MSGVVDFPLIIQPRFSYVEYIFYRFVTTLDVWRFSPYGMMSVGALCRRNPLYGLLSGFAGIAPSAGSKILYAVDPTSGITAFDTTGGLARQAFQIPARSPWDIEWIVN